VQAGRRRLWGGRCFPLAVVLLATALSAMALPAYGQDLGSKLSESESAAADAAAEIGQAETRLEPVEARYAAASRRAAPARTVALAARARAAELKANLADRRRSAAARVSRIEAEHQRQVDDHDQEVKGGLALGLAALVAALLALAWGWFRASAAVAWLSCQSSAQGIGLCVGGGLVLLIIGGALAAADGLIGAVGVTAALLALVLPSALLLARRSAQIQRGRAEPLAGRERMPGWVTRSLSAALFVVCLAGLGTAIFAADPEPETVSAALRERAGGATSAAFDQSLSRAESKADRLAELVSSLGAEQGDARRALAEVRRQLHRGEHRLASAQADARYYAHRIAVVSAKEEREAERRQREEMEEAEEIEATEQTEVEAEAECDPSYVGACLNPYSSDYDCAGGSGDGPDYTGPVQVVGDDHYGLDADGDGYACEE
jgi:hypothetical protein